MLYHLYLLFFIYTLNIESNVIIFMNSGLKVSERGEIQPIQVTNFWKLFYSSSSSKKKCNFLKLSISGAEKEEMVL